LYEVSYYIGPKDEVYGRLKKIGRIRNVDVQKNEKKKLDTEYE